MKVRLVTALLFVNLLLVAGICLFLEDLAGLFAQATPTAAQAAQRARAARTQDRPRVRVLSHRGAAGTNRVVHLPVVSFKTNQFHWSQIESDDYRKYIANLRGVGCPESTIKDLIVTDIMKLYAQRRGTFYHNGREFKYWETNEKRALKDRQLQEREQELAQIDREIPGVLRELLGINYERELNKYFVDSAEDERRLAFVAEPKRGLLLALRDQVESMRERALQGTPDGKPGPDQLQQLDEIESYRQAALGKLLTADEVTEYELRTSETADRLRADLVGFNPSESEFRLIYEQEQALAERFKNDDGTLAAEKAAEKQRMERDLQQKLGPDRYAAYQQSKDPAFRNLCLFSERYDVPTETLQTLHDIKLIAEDERRRLLSNLELRAEQRAEALQAIQQETEHSLHMALGDRLYPKYVENAGGWLKKLTP